MRQTVCGSGHNSICERFVHLYVFVGQYPGGHSQPALDNVKYSHNWRCGQLFNPEKKDSAKRVIGFVLKMRLFSAAICACPPPSQLKVNETSSNAHCVFCIISVQAD